MTYYNNRDKLFLPSLTLEAFADLISFKSHDSIGITEVFLALLKLLLRDRKIVNKIISSIPKSLSIEHRDLHRGQYSRKNDIQNKNSKSSNKNTTSNNNEDEDEETIEKKLQNILNWCDWSLPDSAFDCLYNGLGLLPRHLDLNHLNSITWQSILRCILLRLEPVRSMRKNFTIRVSNLNNNNSNSNSNVNPSTTTNMTSSGSNNGTSNSSNGTSNNGTKATTADSVDLFGKLPIYAVLLLLLLALLLLLLVAVAVIYLYMLRTSMIYMYIYKYTNKWRLSI